MAGWVRFKPRKGVTDVNRAVRSILISAYREVPYYHDLMLRVGLHPSQISGTEDLPRLPITSRKELMAAGERSFLRRSCDRNRLVVRHTTGTTGEPIAVYMSWLENMFRRLTLLDAFRRYVRLRPPLTLVDVGPERKDRSTQPVHHAGPIKIVRLFRTMPLDEQIETLQQITPMVIEGRPSSLWQLTGALRDRGIRPPRPRLIISYAEMLYPHVRKLLEKTFECRVADFYNCEEIGNVACQCPENPDLMHPNPATGWLETVDEKGNPVSYGQVGRLVITNLYNRTMPFIRYDLGDRGALLPPGLCSCGFHGPAMRLTEGRDENFFVLPDGRQITPRLAFDVVNAAFPHNDPTWKHIEAIRVFQIIQTKPDLIVVKVVPGPAYSESLWPKVRESVRQLHPSMRLEIEIVEGLTPAPGKKFHQVLGNLETPWNRTRDPAGRTGI